MHDCNATVSGNLLLRCLGGHAHGHGRQNVLYTVHALAERRMSTLVGQVQLCHQRRRGTVHVTLNEDASLRLRRAASTTCSDD